MKHSLSGGVRWRKRDVRTGVALPPSTMAIYMPENAGVVKVLLATLIPIVIGYFPSYFSSTLFDFC